MNTSPFKLGDTVKLIGIPSQVQQDRRKFPDTFALFERAAGGKFRVRGLDEYGHAELWVSDDGSEDMRGVSHSIWVEPQFLAQCV
jgi:hypothetical protein